MDPERWRHIERLYQLALERAPGQRGAFLEQTCAGDQELRREVESLLVYADGAEEYVKAAAQAVGAQTWDVPNVSVRFAGRVVSQNPSEAPGTAIGRYCLLQKIGEGGMGDVWLAEQKEPVRRRVALKLVKAGMHTREVIGRFESERQALALMDHPAIAKVFDAGYTPQGTPYFVMEYVAGVAITEYCDIHRLNIRERLELFMQVCEGVRHAHQKAIIHRDLKPSNILVAELDGRPGPKIIDFGVAKALGQKLTADTMFTGVGGLVGTPEYMSPEQALSSGEDIDTRTDVYSLGVIFYELLAGAPPLPLRKMAFDQFLRSLREEEPAKPSTKIRTQDPAASVETARKRQSEPLTLARQMRGDLDSIALKALEKDRTRRYGSPSDFAADIGRYLRNEAVLAVAPSVGYRARKFARRYRVALATTSAFVLVLILSAAISIWQSIRATTQRNRADAETAVAQAVNDFLQHDLLAQASAAAQSGRSVKPDPDLKVRTALDRAAARISGKFGTEPQVEAAIRDTIGRTYEDLGLYPEARTQLDRAVDLERRVLGPENPKTLETLRSLGRMAWLQGKYAEAEALLSQNLEVRRRVLGPEHRSTLNSMSDLGNAYADDGKHAQAEALFSQTLKVQRRVLGSEHPDTLSTMSNLARVYLYHGKYAQAEALDSQDLEIQRRVLGSEHPNTFHTMNNLAADYLYEGKYAQAEALLSQTLEMKRRVLGAEHPDTLTSIENLANSYWFQGKHAQAEALFSQTLEIQRRVRGAEHPDTLDAMNNLANAYYSQGKYAAAELLYSQTLGIQRRALGAEHPATLSSIENLAGTYAAQGKYARSEVLFSQSLEGERRVLGPEHPEVLANLSNIASMFQRQGKYTLAETYAAQAVAGRRHVQGPEYPGIDSESDLAIAYQSQGKFAEAEPLAREAVEYERNNRPDDWLRFRAESVLGASLAGQKKYVEAEPLLLEGYQGMVARKDRMDVSDWYYLDRAREWIGQFYKASGKPKEADKWRKK
jgi:Flp pilus assembly protein TadD